MIRNDFFCSIEASRATKIITPSDPMRETDIAHDPYYQVIMNRITLMRPMRKRWGACGISLWGLPTVLMHQVIIISSIFVGHWPIACRNASKHSVPHGKLL